MKQPLTNSYLGSAVLILPIALCLLLSIPGKTRAATQATKGSISVSPGIVNLVLPPGQQTTTSSITLTNNYNTPVRLSAEWQSIDEATGRLIPSGPLSPMLAQSLRISETDIVIPPSGSKQVSVTVQNNPRLAPGGHYAVLLFTVVSNEKQKLGLQSALSVTVFVVKRDGIKTSITLDSVKADHTLFALPTQVEATIINTGNVHVVPRAAVTIERGNHVVAKAVINETSSPLLPGKKAVYTARMVKLQNIYLPSRLKLHTVYRVDQSGEIQEHTSSFWYIPPFLPFFGLVFWAATYFLFRKGKPHLEWLHHSIKHRKRQPVTQHVAAKESDKTTHASKITVSSVEITPTHAVPVERSKKPKKAENKSVKTAKKMATKNNK